MCLSDDFAKLVNNCQGSDVQFRVGNNNDTVLEKNGDTIQDGLTTIYAHSIILRCRSTYFNTMLDTEKQWKESTEGVIYKPNISPETFLDVLRYIYTDNLDFKSPKEYLDLLAAAEEMELEELSEECQEFFIISVKNRLSNAKNMKPDNQPNPIDVIVREIIFPALELAKSHNLSKFSKSIIFLIAGHITTLTSSSEAYTSFLTLISSEQLGRILASDNFFIPERDIWDIALSWACHRTKLSKTSVEARIRAIDSEDNDQENGGVVEAELSHGMVIDNSDSSLEGHTRDSSCGNSIVSTTQLNQLKAILTPLLPNIRFTYFEQEDYENLFDILSYFLSRQRYLKLQRFFFSYNSTYELATGRKLSSKIVLEHTACIFLRRHIFETGAIDGCNSLKDLKFSLLFRVSDHGYASFHRHCDDKGPTLVILESDDGHIFGGVNFISWSSTSGWVKSPSNFLFALPGCHKKKPLIFKSHGTVNVLNDAKSGPSFGNDLRVGCYGKCSSKLPESYIGNKASNTVLAGSSDFTASNCEVFAISKRCVSN